MSIFLDERVAKGVASNPHDFHSKDLTKVAILQDFKHHWMLCIPLHTFAASSNWVKFSFLNVHFFWMKGSQASNLHDFTAHFRKENSTIKRRKACAVKMLFCISSKKKRLTSARAF